MKILSFFLSSVSDRLNNIEKRIKKLKQDKYFLELSMRED